jgi:antitoxin HicB
MMEAFPIVFARDGDAVLVTFPDFPQAQTVGDTRAEARRHAVDALQTAIIALISDRKPLPRPSPARGHATVSLPPLATAKVGLYRAMRRARVNKAELARRLGWHAPQVDRLLDLRHASRLAQIEAALDAVGARLIIDVRAA